MEVSLEGFSIREYTSKMRDTNMEKCWPFDGNPKEMKKEPVEDLLPPITIKKYKWWFSELEKVVLESEKSGIGKQQVGKVVLVEEEERMEINCPVCLCFNASSVKLMGVHIDSCLALSRRDRKKKGLGVREKSKQPKKRSIVEIIAVAPQIEDMDFEEEDDDDDDDEEEEDMFEQDNIRLFDIIANAKRKRKLKGGGDVVGMVKKLKNASMKRACAKKGNSLQKEITHKSKGSIQLGLVRKLKSPISGKKLSSKTKPSRKPNKLKTIRATGKPVHGILKKHPSATDKTSAVGSTMGGDQTKHCHQVDKHVRFSVNHLEKGNNVSPARDEMPEVNGMGSSKELVISVMPGSRIHSISEKEGLNDIDGYMALPTFQRSYNRRHDGQIVLPTMESSSNRYHQELGQGLSHGCVRFTGDFQPQEDFHLLGHSRSSSSHNTLNSGMTQVCYGARHLSDICGVPVQRSAAMDSTMSTASESLKSPLPKRSEADKKYQVVSQHASQNLNSCDFQYQKILELAHKDFQTSIGSLVHPKQKKSAAYEDNYFDDDFIGLPLNSHGELIKPYSSGKGSLNQRKKQNMNAVSNFPFQNFVQLESASDHSDKRKSCCVETALPKDKFKLFPEQSFLENRDRPFRVGTTESQGTGGLEVLWNDNGKNQSVHQLGLELNQMNISSCRCSRYTKNINQTVQEKILRVDNSESGFFPTKQPTMRLMGKDVTVGRNRKEVQGSEDGKEWTDKNVINEHHPTAIIENSSMCANFQIDAVSSGKSKEPESQSFRFQGNPTAPFFTQMNTIGLRYAQSDYNSQPNIMPQSGLHLNAQNQSVEVHPIPCPLPSEELMSRTMRMPGSFIYGAESSNASSQIQIPASSQYPCQCMRLNPTQFLYNHGPPHMLSGSQFPFSSQNCGECVQPSQPRMSSEGLTYWMLNASQQRESPFPSSEYNINAQNLQHNMPGNFSAISSPYITSMISLPNHHAKHLPRTHDSTGTNLVQRPLLPVPPGFRPNSSINSSYRNMINLKNRIKPHIVHQAKRTKKRQAHKPDSSMKYSKSSAERPLESNRDNTKAPEIDADRDKDRDVDHSQMGTYGDGLKSSAAVDSSNMEGVALARSGPLKLSAGAKHILKPSPKTHDENSRPMHSTIPFASVSSSDKLGETQKKPLKIYRL